MALMLTRAGVMSRLGGYRASARGLMRGADAGLRRDIKLVRTGEVVLRFLDRHAQLVSVVGHARRISR